MCQKLSQLCKTDPDKVMATYEDQDPTNTNRITKTMFQQILFRLYNNYRDGVIVVILQAGVPTYRG